MKMLLELIPTICLTSFGFFSVYRFTQPISTKYDENYTDIYTIKMDRIINKIDYINSKLK